MTTGAGAPSVRRSTADLVKTIGNVRTAVAWDRDFREGHPVRRRSVISRTGQTNCMSGRCYHQVLVVDETSPNDPASGHQVKYYAPGTGLVRVGARGGDTQEFLTLAAVRRLDQAQMAKVRAEALAMEQRAYHVRTVYRMTGPAEQVPG